jgi:hypothetical protein
MGRGQPAFSLALNFEPEVKGQYIGIGQVQLKAKGTTV